MATDRNPSAPAAAALAAGGMLLAALGNRRAKDVTALREAAAETVAPRKRDRARQRDRAADANSPAEIPAGGWWAVLKRTVSQIIEDRLLTEAAAVTFFTLLAIFPALAASLSIYGLFADPATMWSHIEGLAGIIPGGGMEILKEQAARLTSKPQEALGLGAFIGLGLSIWSANQAMSAFVDSLNVVYEEKETRSIIKLRLLTLTLTFGAILFLVTAIAAVVLLPIALGFVGLTDETDLIVRLVRWPLMLAGAAFIFAFLYRYGPDRRHARWRWVTWGSSIAAALWIAVSVGFSWYVTNFGSYDEQYGSLGAVVGFMTWIWLSATVVLAGAELDSELEQQTERDTTVGPDQPRGQRGAVVADRVR